MSETETASEIEKAVVIGTGFGGAVVACRLSQAGLKPLVLERGRRYQKEDFPAQPDPSALLPDLRRWTWGNEQGLWDIEDLDEIIAVQAAGYGGGSLIYANVHLRPPPEVLSDERWPKEYREPGFLTPYFNLAGYMLDVAPVADRQGRPLRQGFAVPAKARRLAALDARRRDARGPGAPPRMFYPPLAVNQNHQKAPNKFGVEQHPCTSCGACCTGCPIGAKNTLDLNYLAIAEKHGARVRTQCEVVGIEEHKANGEGPVWVVHYYDHLNAQKVSIRTRYLFVCAGSVHSTRLLAAWQTGLNYDLRDHQLTANLGLGYFPNADAFAVTFDTKEELYPSWGPTITTATVHTPVPSPGGSQNPWFMVQDGGYANTLDRLLGGLRAAAWGRRNFFKEGPLPIPPPERPPTGSPPKGSLSPDEHKGNLRSPVDGLLDALAQKDSQAIATLAVPAQLTGGLVKLLTEVGRPLLPSVVDRTVLNGVERKVRGCKLTGWTEKWMPGVFRGIVSGLKWLALFSLGDATALADDAVKAIIDFGGLRRDDIASKLLGYSPDGAEKRLMLLAMGRDEVPGRLHYDRHADRVYADLDLYHAGPLYMDQELALRDVARDLGGELRVNPAWASLGKPITVHSQGGCPMSDEADDGVTDPNGEVHRHPGLFVMDGALITRAVGVNPSATITAIVERNIDVFLTRLAGTTPVKWPSDEYCRQRHEADQWFAGDDTRGWDLRPPDTGGRTVPHSQVLGLAFDETMTGFFKETVVDPVVDDVAYRKLENEGRPDQPVTLTLTASIEDMQVFFEDMTHTMELAGTLEVKLPPATGLSNPNARAVKGTLELMVPPRNAPPIPGKVTHREKAYGLDPGDAAQKRAIGNQVRLAAGVPYTTSISRHPAVAYRNKAVGSGVKGLQDLTLVARADPLPASEERFMKYTLTFKDDHGNDCTLEGYKRLREKPDMDAWRDTTWLFTKIVRAGQVVAAGVVHVTLPGFIKQLHSLRVFEGEPGNVPDTIDPARVAWQIANFATFFFGSLQRIYWPELGTMVDTFFRPPPQRPVTRVEDKGKA